MSSSQLLTLIRDETTTTRVIEHATYNTNIDFGSRLVFKIDPHHCDLISKVLLQITLPKVKQNHARWINYIGLELISKVKCKIGDMIIDQYSDKWPFVWENLSSPNFAAFEHLVGHTAQLVGLTDVEFKPELEETTLYIPVPLFFSRHPSMALPISLLSDVTIIVDLKPLCDILRVYRECSVTNIDSCSWVPDDTSPALNVSIVAQSLYIDHHYLSEANKSILATIRSFKMEQVMCCYKWAEQSQTIIPLSSTDIGICKEIFWTVLMYRNFSAGDQLNLEVNFTDKRDKLYHKSPTIKQCETDAEFRYANQCEHMSILLAENSLSSHFWGTNPIVVANLTINGEIIIEREGSYFNYLQPYMHHTRSPLEGINCYSFADKPEMANSIGHCDFSKHTAPSELELYLSGKCFSEDGEPLIHIYMLCVNTLLITDGTVVMVNAYKPEIKF